MTSLLREGLRRVVRIEDLGIMSRFSVAVEVPEHRPLVLGGFAGLLRLERERAANRDPIFLRGVFPRLELQDLGVLGEDVEELFRFLFTLALAGPRNLFGALHVEMDILGP